MFNLNKMIAFSVIGALALSVVVFNVLYSAYDFPILKGDSLDLSQKIEQRFPAPQSISLRNEMRNAYFGDLHVHTKHSFDAYIFGTLATPDDAYNFAKGKPVTHPLGFEMKIKRPLDFYAVTDHGFFLGSMEAWANPNNTNAETKPFHRLNDKKKP